MVSPISESNCSSPGSIREGRPRKLLLWQKRWGCSQPAQEHYFLCSLHSLTTREQDGVWNMMASSAPWSASVVQEQVSLLDGQQSPRASLQRVSVRLLQHLSPQFWGGERSQLLQECSLDVSRTAPPVSPRHAAGWGLGHFLTVLQKSKRRLSLCI